MKQKWKGLLTVLLAFALTFGAIQPLAFAEGQEETISVIGSDKTGTLLKETPFTYQENATALEVLIHTVGKDNVLYTESEYGKMITSINGLAAEGNFFWAFYINGVSAQVGADSYSVREGDRISFHYVDWKADKAAKATLKITGNKEKGIIAEKSLSFIDEPNALDLLRVAIGNDKVLTSKMEYGEMITSIDGLAAEGTYYWAFYVNGKMASVGADSYKLKAGDAISFQYESWENPPEGDQEEKEEPAKGEATPVTAEGLQKGIDSASKYILANNVGEWEAVALKQAGKALPKSYLENVKKLVKEKEGRFSKITDTERYTLGIIAAGGNPLNVEGYNLIEKIYSGNLTKQGLNGVVYGLIALNSGDFKVPATAAWTREKMISHLLDNQNGDGGWSWDGGEASDLDTTGMVLTALAAHKKQAGVKQSIDKAVAFLKDKYGAGKIDNSSTAAQVVVALSALGVDPSGEPFTKDGVSLMSYLLTFQNSDGGFDWQGGDASDVFSTAQGFQGLVAYQLFLNGKGSLFELPLAETTPGPVTETPEKQEPVKQEPVPAKVEQPEDQQQAPAKEEQTQAPAKASKPQHEQKSVQAEGKTLPKTATNSYNLLAMGILLLSMGAAVFVWDRRKKA